MKLQDTQQITRKTLTFGLAIALTILLGVIYLPAQTTSVFTNGLNNPAKIITAGLSSLLVAEGGTTAPNNGRVSLVNRATGARRTLIDNLPSALSRSGNPNGDASGPAGLKLSGQKLYLAIGAGDTSLLATGGEILNPNPSSPLFNSVLELTLPADYENLASGFTLSAANQTTLNGNAPVTLTNAEGKQLIIRLVVNLPNFLAEPRPALPENIRPANAYDIEISGDSLYVADASFNLIYRVNIAGGSFSTFAAFAPKPNPTTIGPPVIEAVPDGIRLVGNQFLVPLLTGFPFVAGLSEVRTVNLQTGAQAAFIPNLTSAIDVLPINGTGDNDSYLVLEYSVNMLAQQPGRLKMFASRTDAPRILTSNLVTPTSFARDAQTGSIFVTEISTGRIIRISAPRAVFADFDGDGKSDISVFRPSDRVWYINPSSNPTSFYGGQFGLATDKLVPADYDGDGKTDIAVYRPETGVWYLLRSTQGFGAFQITGLTPSPGDVPVPADYDGDGKAEIGIYRNGFWSAFNLVTNTISVSQQFGLAADKPVPADYDGDGKAELGFFRPSSGTWFALNVSGNTLTVNTQFGLDGDIPLKGDFDGDGKSDLAVFRPSNGFWYVLRSAAAAGQNFDSKRFGLSTDTPVPADYDGDGKTDIAVYRGGIWYILRSPDSQLQYSYFGSAGDIPIPSVYSR